MKIKQHLVVLVFGALLIQWAGITHAQQTRKQKAAYQKAAIEIEKNLRTHIGILADDSFEGRRTGTEGERKTVEYLVNQYQQLKITPGAKDDQFVQPFLIDEGRHYQSSKVEINDQLLDPATDYFVMPWSANGELAISSSVALHESGAPWWVDLKDEISAQAGNPHFSLMDYLKKEAKLAAEKGASALLVYQSNDLTEGPRYNGKDLEKTSAIPVIYLRPKAVKALELGPDSNPYLKASIVLEDKKRTGHNVVAFLDNGASHTIVLGAHLDHLGYGEDENSRSTAGPEIHNGADDNASGTAALLELARSLKAASKEAAAKKASAQALATKKHNYLFIHFSGEELGLFGSKYYANNPTIDLNQVNYMINLDMVGRLTDTSLLTIGGVGTSPQWPVILETEKIKQFRVKIDSSGTGPSDHTSFYRKDLPVLFFFTGLHTDYHKPTDDADKINYPGTAKIVQYILQVVEKSPSQQKLAFTKTREQSMGTGRFKVSVGIMPDYAFSGPGIKVDGVLDGRPAQKAGMATGDIIVQLGEFAIKDMETYMQALNKFEKGQSTQVKIKRGSEEKQLELTF